MPDLKAIFLGKSVLKSLLVFQFGNGYWKYMVQEFLTGWKKLINDTQTHSRSFSTQVQKSAHNP